ncbi:MAG: hypothetical protein JRF35_13615 [Deltaproteobacteria bacterium]|nr:hypothetical protein [Deltaproteobacteria bacterium]
MKSMMMVISMAFVLISCAVSPTELEPTTAPKHPMLEEAMGTIAGKLPSGDHQIVAVLPFTERGIGPTLLGEYVAEKLMVSLSATGRVELVERSRLETVYREQKLGATGLIDDETAASIGNIAGAQAAVVGVLTSFEDCWELTARMLGTSNARVLTIAEACFSAEDVPPNLAGQPIEPRGPRVTKPTEGVPQERVPAQAGQLPVQQPPKVQAPAAPAHPPLHVILEKCLEKRDKEARRRCFRKLINLILSEPTTPQKIAARKCLKIQDHRRRVRCLKKVVGEPEK